MGSVARSRTLGRDSVRQERTFLYFQTAPSHWVLMQSSHVIGFLLVAPQALTRRCCRCSLLPDSAITLRLDAVVPGHVLPPSRVEAASLMPAAPMSFPVWPRGRLLALIPRHEEP